MFSWRDFQRKKTSYISTNYSGAIGEQEFTAKELSSESEWARAGEDHETVLNNAVNYSESGASERR